jgi:hypothetical protein
MKKLVADKRLIIVLVVLLLIVATAIFVVINNNKSQTSLSVDEISKDESGNTVVNVKQSLSAEEKQKLEEDLSKSRNQKVIVEETYPYSDEQANLIAERYKQLDNSDTEYSP